MEIPGCLGNYELHGDDGARRGWSFFLDPKKSATSKITLGRMAVQEHGNGIPTTGNLLGLALTHPPEPYEWPVGCKA